MQSVTFYVIFILFLVMLMIFIIKGHVRQSDFDEYSVGKRTVGTFVFTFAFASRWFVGSIFTVWFIMAAERGLYAQYLVVYTVGALVMLRVFGIPIYNLGQKYKLETQADFIQLRYGNRVFKVIFSGLTLLFWLPWVILEMKTVGTAVYAASQSHIEYNISIIFITMIVIIYSYYGGVRAVNNGAIVQTGIVFIAGVVCSYYLISVIFGSVSDMVTEVHRVNPEFLKISDDRLNRYEWLSATVSGTLGSIVWPGMYSMIYTAKSPKVIKRGSIFAFFFLIPPILLILLLGMGASLIPDIDSSRLTAIFDMAQKYDKPLILSLFGIGTIAASMSMCSAVFNVGGVMIAKDLNPHYNANKRGQTLKVAKVSTVVIGLIALWMATIHIPNLSSVVFLMYNFIIQAGGPIILGLIWRRSNLYGAVSGMAAGILTTAAASIYPHTVIIMGGLSPGIIGLLINLLIHIIVSLLTPHYEKADEIFENLSANKCE